MSEREILAAKLLEKAGSRLRIKVGDIEVEASALNNDLLGNIIDMAMPRLKELKDITSH